MQFAPGREACPLPYHPFKSCTVPRPIGWLSTISADGVHNLAPFSQWQNLTFDPPMVMFAANQLPDGRRKDTVVNAEETGWFTWNMATWDLREAVNISAMVVAIGSRRIRTGRGHQGGLRRRPVRTGRRKPVPLRMPASLDTPPARQLSGRMGRGRLWKGRAHSRRRRGDRRGRQVGHFPDQADRAHGLLRLLRRGRSLRDAHSRGDGRHRRRAGGAAAGVNKSCKVDLDASDCRDVHASTLMRDAPDRGWALGMFLPGTLWRGHFRIFVLLADGEDAPARVAVGARPVSHGLLRNPLSPSAHRCAIRKRRRYALDSGLGICRGPCLAEPAAPCGSVSWNTCF